MLVHDAISVMKDLYVRSWTEYFIPATSHNIRHSRLLTMSKQGYKNTPIHFLWDFREPHYDMQNPQWVYKQQFCHTPELGDVENLALFYFKLHSKIYMYTDQSMSPVPACVPCRKSRLGSGSDLASVEGHISAWFPTWWLRSAGHCAPFVLCRPGDCQAPKLAKQPQTLR